MQYVRPFLLTFACILQYVRQPLDDAQRGLRKHSKDAQRAQRELTGRSKGVRRAQRTSNKRSKDVQRAQRALTGHSKGVQRTRKERKGRPLEGIWSTFRAQMEPLWPSCSSLEHKRRSCEKALFLHRKTIDFRCPGTPRSTQKHSQISLGTTLDEQKEERCDAKHLQMPKVE